MNLNKLYEKLGKYFINYDSEIVRDVLRDIETEIITNGKINRGLKTAFNRLLRDNEYRTNLKQVCESENGAYTLCNGFYLVDYGKDKNNVPKELQAYINIIDCKKTSLDFDHVKLNEQEDITEHTILIEDLEKLHKYARINTEDRIPYRIENTYINASYLLDILALMGIDRKNSVTIRKSNSPYAPIEIINGETRSILLPIKVTELKEHYDEKFEEIIKM